MKVYEYILRIKDQASDKMARFANVANRARPAVDRLGGSMKRTEGSSLSLSNAIGQLARFIGPLARFIGLARLIGPAVLGAALVSTTLKASSLAREFEQTKISFEIMMGSAARGNALLGEMIEMANVTPFTSRDLQSSGKVLLGFGVAAQKIMPTLKMLGDISGGNSEKLQLLSLAFAQSQAAGRLMGQDLLQMVNSGFNPLQVISEKTGLSMGVLKKKMEEGAISAQMVEAAFRMATEEGGRFHGMMERQSATFAGRLSTLKDKVELWATFVGQKLNDKVSPILDKSIQLLDRLVDTPKGIMNEFDSSLKEYRKFKQELSPLVETFARLQEKGPTGRMAQETKEYIETYQKLKTLIPIAATRDSITGEITGFNVEAARSFIDKQKDSALVSMIDRVSELKKEVQKKDEFIRIEKGGDNSLEKIAKLTAEKSRILGLIDEAKSKIATRGETFNYVAGGLTDNKIFDPLKSLSTGKGAKDEEEGGINRITGGGKQSVNVTINVENLNGIANVESVQGDGEVKDLMKMMERAAVEAMIRVVNSANYAAAQ